MNDQDTTIAIEVPGDAAERDAWVARVLGVTVSRRPEAKQDYGPGETRPPPNRPPPNAPQAQESAPPNRPLPPLPTQGTGSPPPNRPPPPVPARDPDRELFGRELIAVEGRLDYLCNAESGDTAVKAAQGDLTGTLIEMNKAADEKRYGDARTHLGTAKGHADRVETALEQAGTSEREFMADYGKITGRRQAAVDAQPPTQWTKKAKAEFVTADDVLQKHIADKTWAQAGTALLTVVGSLDRLDAAAKRELESRLDLLDAWPNAQTESGALRGELNKLTTPLLADRGYIDVSNAIQAAATGWRNVRVHAVEMGKLAAEFGCLAHVKGPGANPALRPAWADYDAARAAAPNPAAITTTANHDKLAELRDEYAKAGRALLKVWESGVAGAPSDDPYWKAVAQEGAGRNTIPLRQAYKVPPTTPEIARLQQELHTLEDQRLGTWEEIAAKQRSISDKCAALIALRTSDKDPALVALFADYRKAEKNLKAAADGVPATGATPTQQTYKTRYTAFVLKLNGKDDDIVAVCTPELQWLIAQAEAALGAATTALRTQTTNIAAMPAGDNAEELAKAQAAFDEIDAADPVTLARLSADEKLSLLDSLRANGMPAFDGTTEATRDATRADPRRVAMRKIYQALTLEAEFARKDAEDRKKLLDALKGKKQELKDAKENWSAMTDDQKVALLKSVAEEQSKQLGFTMPSNGIVVANEPHSGDNGSYAPADLDHDPAVGHPESDRIKINSAMPVFHDFEAALDLIIHENSHRNQNVLCRALRYPKGNPPYLTKANADPPYTQTRMFNVGNVDGGYVSGSEDYEVYKKQPEEEHAWLAGPRGAQGIMDMLAEE